VSVPREDKKEERHKEFFAESSDSSTLSSHENDHRWKTNTLRGAIQYLEKSNNKVLVRVNIARGTNS
jgi:hypothetical protein